MFAISNRWNVGTSCGLNGGVGSTRPRVAWRGKVMFTPKTFNDISWHRLIYTDIIWLYLIPIIGLERTPKFLVMFLHGRNKHIFFWREKITHVGLPGCGACEENISPELCRSNEERRICTDTLNGQREYVMMFHIQCYGILWTILEYYETYELFICHNISSKNG